METVKIRKKNRIKHVAANRVEAFLKQGYDQIDENGNIVRRATGGKTVSLAEYNKVLDELEKWKKATSGSVELEALKKELETLKKENASLKGKITKLEKAAKANEKTDGPEGVK